MNSTTLIKHSISLGDAASQLLEQIRVLHDNQDEVCENLDIHPDCGDCLEVACAMALILRERAQELESVKKAPEDIAYLANEIQVSALLRTYEKNDDRDLVHASVSFGSSYFGLNSQTDDLCTLCDYKHWQDRQADAYDRDYEILSFSIDDLIEFEAKDLLEEFGAMRKNHNNQPLLNWDNVHSLKEQLLEQERILNNPSASPSA